jgi:hypothetical protein
MFHGHLDCFQKPPLGGRPNTKPLGDHGTSNAHNRWFILFYHVQGPVKDPHEHTFIVIVFNGWEPITYDFTLLLRVRDHTIWGVLGQPSDTYFWNSEYHGHSSWLVYEVALNLPWQTLGEVDRSWGPRSNILGQPQTNMKFQIPTEHRCMPSHISEKKIKKLPLAFLQVGGMSQKL